MSGINRGVIEARQPAQLAHCHVTYCLGVRAAVKHGSHAADDADRITERLPGAGFGVDGITVARPANGQVKMTRCAFKLAIENVASGILVPKQRNSIANAVDGVGFEQVCDWRFEQILRRSTDQVSGIGRNRADPPIVAQLDMKPDRLDDIV